jgi:type II secretory pathway component GspD/PulD (secretin)
MPGWQKMIRSLDNSTSKPGEVTELVRLENARPAPIQRALQLIDSLPVDGSTTVAATSAAGAFRTAALPQGVANAQPQPPRGQAQPQPPAPQLPPPAPDNRAPNNQAPDNQAQGDDQAAGNAAAGEEAAGIIGDTQIQFVPELGIIIVRGAKRDTQRVLDVIRQIEEQSAVTQPEVEIFQLKHLNSVAAADLLNEVYEEVLAARQGEVNIRPLDQPNAILLVGRRESVAAAITLIEKLDQPLDSTSRLRVFPLKHASARDVETTVRGFFVEKPGSEEDNRAGLGTRVRVIADYRTNALVIGASPRDLEEVEQLIKDIDVETVPAQNEIRVFPLKNSRADDLAPVIQGAINGEGEAEAAEDTTRPSTSLSILAVDSEEGQMLSSGILSNLVVTADANANALIVRGPSSSMELVGELIRQLDQVPGVETVVKVFTVENGDATQLTTALNNLFGAAAQQGGGGGGAQAGGGGIIGQLSGSTSADSSLVNLRFTTDVRTNSIIATGSDSDLEVVESILLRLDTKGFAERITEVIWLRHQTAPEIAAAIQQYVQQRTQTVNTIQQFQQGLGALDLPDRDLIVVAEEVSNSLLLSCSPRVYQDVRQLIEALDRRPPMVLIKVVLAEVLLSDNFEFGGELGLQDSLLFDRSVAAAPAIPTTPADAGFNFNTNGTANRAAISPGVVASQALTTFGLGNTSSTTGYGGFVLSAASDSFSLLLRALQDANRAQILSRPQIMTVDNKVGFVQVGQRVARIIGLSQGGVNFAPILNIEDIDIGLILEVLPRVGADGLISMLIRAERSDIDTTTNGTPIGTTNNGGLTGTNTPIYVPNINTTAAESTIVAYSGQTVVFGGLIQKERINVSRRVPYLSNIPLLGIFFRFDREAEERRELLVIMTPMLVNGDEDLEYIKRVESSRMSYCLADVVEMHGDVGLSEGYGLWGPAVGATIYPDLQPTVDQFPTVSAPGETVIGERTIGQSVLAGPQADAMFQSAPQANGVIINSPIGDDMIQESPVNLEPNDARALRERYDGPYQGQPSEMPIRGEAIPTPSGQPIDTYAPPEARLFNESPQSGIRSAPNGTTLPAVNGTTFPAVNGTGLPAVNANPGQAPLPSQGRANQPLPNQPLPAQPNQGAVPSTNVTPGAQTQNRLAPSGSLRERFTPFRRNPAPNGLPTNNIPQSGSTPAAMQTPPTTVRPVGLQGPGGPG